MNDKKVLFAVTYQYRSINAAAAYQRMVVGCQKEQRTSSFVIFDKTLNNNRL
jgi:hypothetical protein